MNTAQTCILAVLLLTLLCTGCTVPSEKNQPYSGLDTTVSFEDTTTASLETTTAVESTTTTTIKTIATTSPMLTSTAIIETTSPTATTVCRPTTTNKPATTKSKTKRKTTTTKFSYIWKQKDIHRIKIETFVFDYESEDYQRFYDLVEKYCNDPDLKEYQIDKVTSWFDRDPQTGEYGLMGFYLKLRRYINGCESENVYTLQLDKVNGEYKTDTLICQINDYDPSKVKPPRKPTEKEEEVALRSEKKRVQKLIEQQWPKSNYVVVYQEAIYKYNIKHDYNYFLITTKYGKKGTDGIGAMSAQFEIKR